MQETQLDHAIDAIRVRFGSQALTRAAQLPPPQPWPSCTPLDGLTGIGGLPRGRLTLLTGGGTCGKLTLALAMLASATREFAHAVVIDRSSFDPWALLPFDPDLSSLTVVRLESDPAGEAAAALAKAGAGFILLMGEVPEHWIGPLEAGANRSGTVLVGVVNTPGRAFAHASSLSIGFSRTEWVIERGGLIGLRTIARCLKNRVAPPLGESELEIRYPQGAQLFLERPISLFPSGRGALSKYPESEEPLQLAELECTSAVV
jgi:recombination protein RecA